MKKLACVASFLCLGAIGAEVRNPLPAVGVFGRDAWPIIDHLRSKGFQITYLYYGSDYTERFLRQFNVLVVAENAEIDPRVRQNGPTGVKPEYDEQMRALLTGFVENGGGLLAYGGIDSAKPRPTNALLLRWGAELLNETINDAAHKFTQRGGMGWEYNYTQEIAPHPVTKDVKTIFYPLRSLYGQGNQPLQLGPEWAVLIRGTEQATSHPMKQIQEQTYIDTDKPGTYRSRPPLAAARDAGKGRVAILAWNPVQTFFNLGHFMVEDIHFTRGGDGKSSDGLRLLEQALTWLGEPSLAMPTAYGGYRNKPFRTQPKFPEPLVWNKIKIGGPSQDRHWFNGLIGARSALTGGTGSVAEYAAAAKTAKLDFIAFLEDWTKLDQQSWDAFRAECRQASTPALLVMPGYAYPRGTIKDIYFKVGDIPWQRRDMCTADGASVRNVEFDMFGDGECLIGPFDIRNLKSPFWRANAYNSFAVATTRDGKTDWDLDPFLAVTEIRDNPRPLAVDLLTAPAQVAAAAKRFRTCLRVKDQEEARKAFKQPDQFNHWSQVSNGPMITHVQSENAWRKAYGKAIPGTERIMTRIMGESGQPLTELAVYDGTRLVRRYALSGKTFDVTMNALHDRAHAWTYVLTDAAGGKAVRAISGSTDFFHHRFMCGDRQNTLASSFDIDKDGNEVNIAAACMQQKSIVRGFGFPANAQIIQRVPWGWDGCAGGIAEGVCNPRVTLPLPVPEIKGEEPCIFGRIELPLASRDVICQATRWDYACSSMSEAYSTHAPLIPLGDYTASARCFEFKKTPGASAAMLIEGYYRMLKDGEFKPGAWWYTAKMSHTFYNFGGRPNELASYAFMNYAGNDCRVGAFPPKNQWINDMAPLAPGGYFAVFNRQESAAVFPLDRSMLAAMSLMQDGWGRVALGYDDYMNKPFKKGDVVPFRLVLWNGPLGQPPDNRQIEQFRTSFGLHGGKPAYTVTPRQGKILSTAYLLDLEAHNGGFAGTFTKAPLQHRLPVRVHGVNPNWSCGIVDTRDKWWLPTGTMPDLPELAPTPAAGTGYATYAAVDIATDRDLYLGNVVVCDQPELVLTLLPDGEGGYAIEAHNPTDKAITAQVATVPEFTLCPAIQGSVTVPPGASAVVAAIHKDNEK